MLSGALQNALNKLLVVDAKRGSQGCSCDVGAADREEETGINKITLWVGMMSTVQPAPTSSGQLSALPSKPVSSSR
jgi:hypothetical protein